MGSDSALKMLVLSNVLSILGLLVREIYGGLKSRTSNQDGLLSANIEATNQLSLSLLELKIRIDHLNETMAALPRLQEELRKLHDRILELEVRMENG